METRNSVRPLGPIVIDIENITRDYVMGEEVVRALRGVSLEIRRNEYIAIMGPSGSGKSSLAFETIYAEGQRRYVETFSPYMRQFLDRMDKPRVDDIRGIPPAYLHRSFFRYSQFAARLL